MKKIIIFSLFLFILSGCDNTIRNGFITCNQMDEILTYENSFLIDVRGENEYIEGHLDNAINYSYENIITSVENDDNINKDSYIVLYCKSGARAQTAYELLIGEGYLHVYTIGGMSNCD